MSFDPVFDELDIQTDPFAICQLRGACDLGVGRDAQATLHYILSGSGEIKLRGQPPLPVARGSLVMVPAQQSHALRSFGEVTDPIPVCKPAELSLAALMSSQDCKNDSKMVALCAHVTVGLKGVTDLVDLVRVPLVETVGRDDDLRPALQMLLRELATSRVGSRAMIRAILTQCMIELLRRRVSQRDNSLGWMAALTDPQIWGALCHMLDHPGEAHTVESLADRAGMSRSAFAKRFSEAYAAGPMHLLRDLRMRKASNLLATTDLPIKRVAELVGFASRSAFTRTFETKCGQLPSEFRNLRRAAQGHLYATY